MRAIWPSGQAWTWPPSAAVRHCMMARAALRTWAGKRMGLLVGRKGIVEDRLQRDERHRCLRPRGRDSQSGYFLQYHANYLRGKRLVQRWASAAPEAGARHERTLAAVACTPL